MKLIGCFCVLALCCNSVRAGSMEDGILNFLEELRKRMCHPIPKFGLPALDPMQKAEANVSLNGDYLRDICYSGVIIDSVVSGLSTDAPYAFVNFNILQIYRKLIPTDYLKCFNATVKDFKMVGLAGFEVIEIRFPTLFSQRFVFDVKFPSTRAESQYTANGSAAGVVDIDGKGDLRGRLEELRITITCSTRLGLHLSIRNLLIKFSIGEINVFLQDFITDERINDFAHSVVNEIGIDLLNEFWGMTHAKVEANIQKRINDFASKYPLSKIIAIIAGSGSDEPIFGPEDPPGDCTYEPQEPQPEAVLITG